MGKAKGWLREQGSSGRRLASRLGRLSKARNASSHPDVSLLRDIRSLNNGAFDAPCPTTSTCFSAGLQAGAGLSESSDESEGRFLRDAGKPLAHGTDGKGTSRKQPMAQECAAGDVALSRSPLLIRAGGPHIDRAVAGTPSGTAAPHEHVAPQDLKSSSAGDEYVHELTRTLDLASAPRGDDCRLLGVQAAVSKRASRCTQTTQALQLPAVAYVGAHSPADEGTEKEEDAPMFFLVFRHAALQSDLTGDQLRHLAKRLGLTASPGPIHAS